MARPTTDADWLRWNAAQHIEQHRKLLATPLPPAGPRRAYRESVLRHRRTAAGRCLQWARQCEAGASALDLVPVNSSVIVAAVFGGAA